MNYEEKYLKYKNKYLNLKNDSLQQQVGGMPPNNIFDEFNPYQLRGSTRMCSVLVFVLYIRILLIEYRNGASGENVEDIKKKLLTLYNNYFNTTSDGQTSFSRRSFTPIHFLLTTNMYYSEVDSKAETFADTLFEYIKMTEYYKESTFISKEIIKNILMLKGKKLSSKEYIDRYGAIFMDSMNAYLNGYNEDNFNIKSARTFLISVYSNALNALYVTYEYTHSSYKTYPTIELKPETAESLAKFIYTIMKESSNYIENDFTNQDAIKNILLLNPVVLTKEKTLTLTHGDEETYLKNIARRIYNLLKKYKNGESVENKNFKTWKEELLKNYNYLVIVSKDPLEKPDDNIINIEKDLLGIIKSAKSYDNLIKPSNLKDNIQFRYDKFIGNAVIIATTINRIIGTYKFTSSATEPFITIPAILYLLLERLPPK